MLKLADEDGFPMVLPDLIPKTHKALTLGEYARDAGPEAHMRVHAGIFAAYYGEGRDIADTTVLLDVARSAGLDAEAAGEAIADDRYAERLHSFRHLAIHLGIDATPAALICNELLIGSRPYRILKDSLDRCLVRPDTLGVPPGTPDAPSGNMPDTGGH